MADLPSGVDWSPADNPYAIAVSEATWWLCAVRLTIGRLNDAPDGRAAPMSSAQIDARSLIFALVQLLAAERLEQTALRKLGMDPAVGEALDRARECYVNALPNIQDMRNALAHFDDWALGAGHGLQKSWAKNGSELRDIAGHYWGFGYDPGRRVVKLGPLTIEVEKAALAARDLHRAIYAAARQVDHRSGRECE